MEAPSLKEEGTNQGKMEHAEQAADKGIWDIKNELPVPLLEPQVLSSVISFTSFILISFRINEDTFGCFQTCCFLATKLLSLLLYHDVKVGFVQKVCKSAPRFVTTCLCSSTKQVGEKLLSELVKNTDVADGEKEKEEWKEDSKINAF